MCSYGRKQVLSNTGSIVRVLQHILSYLYQLQGYHMDSTCIIFHQIN